MIKDETTSKLHKFQPELLVAFVQNEIFGSASWALQLQDDLFGLDVGLQDGRHFLCPNPRWKRFDNVFENIIKHVLKHAVSCESKCRSFNALNTNKIK